MSETAFRVTEHRSLAFKDNYLWVNRFIERRLGHFFPGARVEFGSVDPAARQGEVIVELSSINPFLDVELAVRMIEMVSDEAAAAPTLVARSSGHVPGTQPLRVYREGSTQTECVVVHSELQSRFNSQFNLHKLKRQKHFRSFVDEVPDLHAMSLPGFLEYLATDEGTELFLRYGEPISLLHHSECPHCACTELVPQRSTSSQSLNGFLPQQASIYSRCTRCGLVFLTRTFPREEIGRIYDDYLNEFALHEQQGKVLHQFDELHMFVRALDRIEPILPNGPTVIDLGCGGGEFLTLARERIPSAELIGIDFFIAEEKARILGSRNVDIRVGNLVEQLGRPGTTAHLVTAWEVVEHLFLDDFKNLLRRVLDTLLPGGFFVFSTPDFDSPMCRIFDFWAACPIQHLMVFSESWLDRFLADEGAMVRDKFHSNRMARDAAWARYCAETAPTPGHAASAELFVRLLEKSPSRASMHEAFDHAGVGSEIVYVVQKTPAGTLPS